MSQTDSDADIVYYKVKNVLSDDLSKTATRVDYLNAFVDIFVNKGEENHLRYHYGQPWCKTIKKELVDYHHLRFDEVQFGNDTYFSVFAGHYAKKIDAVDIVLYIYTYRPESLSGEYGSKPNELKDRAGVAFRIEKLFRQLNVNEDLQTPFIWFLKKMLQQDRDLFRYYFFKLDEVYSSRYAGLRLLSQGKSIKFKTKLFFYSMWLWISRPLVS